MFADLKCDVDNRHVLTLLLVVLGIAALFTVAPASVSEAQGNEMVVRVVFDDRVGSVFRDESWTKRDDRNRDVVRSGRNSLAFEADWWGGVAYRGDLVDLRGATALSVWLSGGPTGGQNVHVTLKVNGRQSDRFVRGLDRQWQEIRVPLSDVGGAPSARADVSVAVVADVDADQPTVYVDDVYFVGPATGNTRPAGQRPFPGGLVSFSFDDNAAGQAAIARPLLNAAGFKGTFYTPTSFVQPDNEAALGWSQMKAMVAEGHEMAGHSITHADMSQLGVGALEKELADPIALIRQQTGANVRSFATPSGAYTARELPFFEKYYESHRNAWINLNDAAADRYQLYVISGDTDFAKIQAELEEAVASERWAILIYHQINETGTGFFAASRSNFSRTIDFVRSRGIPVARVDEGVERLRRPIAVAPRPNSNGRPKAILTAEQAKATPIGAETPAAAAPNPVPAPSPVSQLPAPAPLPPAIVTPTTAAPIASPTTVAGTTAKLPPKLVPSTKRGSSKGFVVFSDTLAPGVDDWSWATRNLASTSPARGRVAIRADLSEWKGIYFHGAVDLTGTTTLEMYVHGGTKGGQNLKVIGRTGTAAYKSVAIAPIKAKTWSRIRIPMSKLAMSAEKVTFDLQIADASGTVQESVSVDDVRFTR